MQAYPQTIIEFRERFATERACEEYVAALRWPQGFVCPECQEKRAWEMQRGLHWCRHCGYQASVTAGTLFHDTHKPLRLWFEAMWYVTNQKSGVSALGLQRVLGLGSYHTAWNWLHKLRRAMVRPGRDRLNGVVEVDEIFIGGERSGKRGRGAEGKALVVIAAQEQEDHKGIGRIRMRRVADAAGESLEPAVWEMVEPGSTVRTDGWRGYNGLAELGYQHNVVHKTADLGENLLPLVNLVASLLKRWLLGTHQGAVRHSHLEYYLDEYTFRFNRRTSRSRGLLFYRLLSQAIDLGPVLENELKGGRNTQESTA
ncbi:MAG: IS1595 family transposase [Verrucomicrobia bacterium]|nr:IS1595 family transposase [Verrucomicrobiota bacterium]